MAIKSEEDHVIATGIRFGHRHPVHGDAMTDEMHRRESAKLTIIYLCNITEASDLSEACLLDISNLAMNNKRELIDVVETIYRESNKSSY
ncbi:hypothetical protein H4582DRAFT_1312270 [Lactarius indigo]|nr:hypothetical protein H4582DRAFT_1312270 [Lactarius indigo]